MVSSKIRFSPFFENPSHRFTSRAMHYGKQGIYHRKSILHIQKTQTTESLILGY